MVKIAGIIMIMFSTTYIGYYLSFNLHRRIESLENVAFTLKEMASQVRFGQDVLYDVFGRTKEKTDGCIRKWLELMMLDIDMSMKSLDVIWRDNCSVLKEAGLIEEDIGLITQIGNYITGENLERIEDIFLGQEIMIEKRLKLLTEEYRNKSKVYKSLGILCGIFICVIII